MNVITGVLLPLAADKVPDPADVKPGWLGFGMFLALAAATVLLWLSFRRQLKKVRFDVDPLPPRRPSAAARSAIRAPAAGSSTGPSAGTSAGPSADAPPAEGDPSET